MGPLCQKNSSKKLCCPAHCASDQAPADVYQYGYYRDMASEMGDSDLLVKLSGGRGKIS